MPLSLPAPLSPSLLSPSLPHSVATTLGLNRVAAQTLKLAQEHEVFSQLVTDQEAVAAVEQFMGESQRPPGALHLVLRASGHAETLLLLIVPHNAKYITECLILVVVVVIIIIIIIMSRMCTDI